MASSNGSPLAVARSKKAEQPIHVGFGRRLGGRRGGRVGRGPFRAASFAREAFGTGPDGEEAFAGVLAGAVAGED